MLQPFGLDETALRKQIFFPDCARQSAAKALRLFDKESLIGVSNR